MDSKTMLDREPFKKVLISTINEYFHNVAKKDIKAAEIQENGLTAAYVFMKPFFVSYFPFPDGLAEHLYSEYNIRGSILKYIIGKAGVFATLNSGALLAKDKIFISEEAKNEGFFIGPCNRTIRFYYYKEEYVDIIVKKGYRNDFLANQIAFREKVDIPFIPKILEHGDNWYREAIMHGNALARVRSDRVYKQALKQVDDALQTLASYERKTVSSADYCDQLRGEAIRLAKAIDNGMADNLSAVLSELKIDTMKVPIAISHGDLQSGNIWVERNGKTLIYDWETVARRSVWFDPTVLYRNLHSGCFAVNIYQSLNADKRIFANDINKDEYGEREYRIIEKIIVLEDLIFCLNEATQLLPEYALPRTRIVVDSFEKYFRERLHG